MPLRSPQGGIEVNVLRDLKGTLKGTLGAEAVVVRLRPGPTQFIFPFCADERSPR